jgi:hypothetical protein
MSRAVVPAAVVILLGLAAILVGCASSGAAYPAPAGAASGAAGASAAPAAPQDDSSNAGGQGSEAAQPSPAGVTVGDDGPTRDGARIVRTGTLQLEVEDVRAALRSARDTIVAMGGYIGASRQTTDEDGIVATVSYRIPEVRWEDALDALRKLGNEVGEETDATEVTNQIVDLDARIRNLKASETALVRYASEAVKVTDLLEVESRLSDVRGQIEQLTAQKQNLEDQSSYSTLSVTFGTEVAAVEVAADQWDPTREVDHAGASLLGFVQGLTTIGIWFVIVWVPVLAFVAILAIISLLVARRLGLFRGPALPAAPSDG